MKTLKHSKQRDAIKAFLISRADHPTADVVYEHIKKEFSNISLGTVYRNLNLLVETHEAIKISSKTGADRFDARVVPHYHFVCTRCGSVKDVLMSPIKNVEQEAAPFTEGVITGHEITFLGVCNICSKNEN